jgi:thymidylate synthase (FAD)
MAYIARVTSKDQENPNFKNLLKYCFKHGHWSVAEQATLTIEAVTPLAIAVQLLRHRSMTFQQFSGRYEDQQEMAKHTDGLSCYNSLFYMPEEAREQDTKNRQNSTFSSDPGLTDKMWDVMSASYKVAQQCYGELLDMGIAKEIARFVLPQGVYSRLYITGSCRSWIHYLKVRDDEGVAQYEHCELARCAKEVFAQQFPTAYESIDWHGSPQSGDVESIRRQLAESQCEIATLKSQLSNRL